MVLLALPRHSSAPGPAEPPPVAAPDGHASSLSPPGHPGHGSRAASATPPALQYATALSTPQPATGRALPPRGDGQAGDAAVQRALEAAWPPDLSAGDERELLDAGRAILRADATGFGRARWPDVFSSAGQGLAPAFATARFRIQAGIARRDGADGRAVVHLVWAGADRAGAFSDGRISQVHFSRTTMLKGGSRWTPQLRT
ncbi:hypothetical protein [Streptomyces cadmiisoli]|uniref:hypothetical protein n=1 Tax=Streptomyces cadmiisoli TaxID=2184053 RepID=UPI001FE932E1|nr:hypothetical protein [Streptomyces cadmiisoli]